MRRLSVVFILILAATMILVPVIFVTLLGKDEPAVSMDDSPVQLEVNTEVYLPVKVYRSGTKQIETYPLEEYVRGVIAAEMPASFELEALKAQALAARTYIVKRILDKSYSDVPQGAMVTDTVKHQVFKSDEELKRIWGASYAKNISKLNKAINETSGQVITYKGLPITALFFSTSNGYTENSEDYWQKAVPYLRSVESPWDQDSPKFNATKLITYGTLKSVLGVDGAVLASTGQNWLQLIESTEGKRISKVKIGEKVLTGREVRELFDLNSSGFTWELTNQGILFKTKGYGHGVGMSQYGANGMAKEGKTAKDIIKHYYTGVEITDIQAWVKQ